jgi:F-type H+-transporting ATPase subunit alpha
VEDIRRFEAEFLDYLQRNEPGIYDAIRETGDLKDDTVVALKDAIDAFRSQFEKTGGELLVTEEPAKPLAADEVQPEKIRQYEIRGESESTGIEDDPGTTPRTGGESE